KAVHVELEMVADRHRVAHDHAVVGIGPGVDLGPRAHIAPGDEVARIDEPDHRLHFSCSGLDVRSARRGRGHWHAPEEDSIVRYYCATSAGAGQVRTRRYGSDKIAQGERDHEPPAADDRRPPDLGHV